MAKKKGKKKKNSVANYTMDDMLNYQYLSLVDEINHYQAEIKRADKKGKKKALKAFNGKGFYPYEYELAARERVVNEMEGSGFIDRILKCFQEMAPIIQLISRLVAALVVAILSISQIKGRINKNTLKKLQNIYEFAMSVC